MCAVAKELPVSSPPPRWAAPVLQNRLKRFQTKVRLLRSKLYSSSPFLRVSMEKSGVSDGGVEGSSCASRSAVVSHLARAFERAAAKHCLLLFPQIPFPDRLFPVAGVEIQRSSLPPGCTRSVASEAAPPLNGELVASGCRVLSPLCGLSCCKGKRILREQTGRSGP